MQPIVKSIDGAGFDWLDFSPDHLRNFGCWLVVGIGPRSDNSVEIYQFRVCTPSRIEEQLENGKPIWGVNTLFVERFDRERIEAALHELVRRMGEGSWTVIQQRLKGFMSSEYEDYQY